MNVTIDEVKSYQKGARGPIGKFLDKVFLFVPYLAINYGISANVITFCALILDLLAVAFILKGWTLLAGVLVLLSYIGDISDGTVARYENKGKGYGQFLDEVLGVIGFTLVVFALGLHFDMPWLGLAAMVGIFMMNVTTAEAKLAIKNKKEISERLQAHRFKFQIGFTCDVQRTLVALAVMLSSTVLLFIFALGANLLWLSKFWIYRKH
jgi:phosphatidylglycerophosphate synthase